MRHNRHRRAAVWMAALVWWLVRSTTAAGAPPAAHATIAMIIAPAQFRDEEFLAPKKCFEQAHCTVRVFSTTTNVVTGMLGAQVRPDALLATLDVRAFDALVFVGGSGAQTYWNDPRCHTLCRAAVAQGKVLGAICIAPVILARAGVLTNVPATVFPGVKHELQAGARYSTKPIVVAGRIVTADRPTSATTFAQALLRVLQSTPATP